MARGKRPGQQTLRYKAAIIFILTSLIPLLLFLFVLDRKHLIEETDAALSLGLSVCIAIVGFLLFLRTVRQLSQLAHDVVRLQQGAMHTLDTPQEAHDFAEMALITESFHKILSELKVNTSELASLVYKLSTLSDVTDLVSRVPDIREVLHLVLHRAMTAVQSQIGSIMLLDVPTQTLRIAAAEGLDETVVAGTTVRVGEGIAGKVMQTGEPMLVEDVEQDKRVQKANDPKYDASSLICMPLRAQDRIIGVLNLSKKSGQRAFSTFDINFLSTLLGHIGFAVENARLLEDAKEAALALRHVVHEKSAQLELAQYQLQQSNTFTAQHHLMTRMAHVLHPPLTKALRYAQLLMTKVEDREMHEVSRRMLYETQRATDTLHHFLTFVEPPPLHQRPEQLNAVLGEALKRQSYDLRMGKITVQAEYDEELPPIPLDVPQIQQAFMHILTNACQAMAAYGPTRVLHLRTAQHETGQRVDIVDTGSGITGEHMPHIFTPFFTTKDRAKAMGLGLSIARTIIRAHQGTLSVYSEGGRGVTVVVELRSAEMAEQEPSALPNA